MSATFNVNLTITRQGDAGDAKGTLPPKVFNLSLPGLTDDEIQIKLAAGALNQVVAIPSVGVPGLVFIRTDQPVSYTRNAELIVNQLGTGGYSLSAGVPQSGVPITQLVFSNPGTIAATVYILVAGQ